MVIGNDKGKSRVGFPTEMTKKQKYSTNCDSKFSL